MKILIAGGTGFIGSELTKNLIGRGYDVRILSRKQQPIKNGVIRYFKWSPENGGIDLAAFNDLDVVINLVGENIANKRWSDTQRKKLLSSRTISTSLIIESLKKCQSKALLINSSAIGFYGNKEEFEVDENSKNGTDFLSELCQEWENTVIHNNYTPYKIIRTGLVLSPRGGALQKMLTPFKLGLGGPVGNGKQYMSWIHIEDMVNAIIHLCTNGSTNNVYNLVGPTPVTNYEFTKTLGKVLKRPTVFKVPSTPLKLALGDMAQLLLTGQKVSSKKLELTGYQFKFKNLEDAFKSFL